MSSELAGGSLGSELADSSLNNEPVGASASRPLKIALAVDTVGNRGNGTSNSALQFADELRRQGHLVRIVGVGAPQFAVPEHRIPIVSEVAARQQMQFATPGRAVLHRAFAGADVVHIYLPFAFGRTAASVARAMGISVTAGFHLQPENILASLGPVGSLPGAPQALYRLFWRWLYRDIRHVHVPSEMGKRQLLKNGYSNDLHVFSNGYDPHFSPCTGGSVGDFGSAVDDFAFDDPAHSACHFRVIASGRLAAEKDQETLIRAAGLSKYADRIDVIIAGTGPLERRLKHLGAQVLCNPLTLGFRPHSSMPDFLRSADLFVHPSIADEESISVIEAMACGCVPVIAKSPLSAASQFALCEQSLFPTQDAAALAARIDWWIEHPAARARYSAAYAQQAAQKYSVTASVKQFVAMERAAIADGNPTKPLKLQRM